MRTTCCFGRLSYSHLFPVRAHSSQVGRVLSHFALRFRQATQDWRAGPFEKVGTGDGSVDGEGVTDS